MLNYEIKGSGPSLLLIHGFLCTSSVWELLIARLEKTYQLILVDLPGHGASENVSCGSIAEMAEHIKAALNEADISKCTVLGHSMGGYVALELAEHNPELIEELILLHSTPFEDSMEKKRQRQRAIGAVKKTQRLFVSQFIPKLFAIQNIQRCILFISDIEKEALRITKACIIESLQAMKCRKDYSDKIDKWPFKTKIILGLDDPVIDSVLLMERYGGTDNVSIYCISDTGHMGFYECPDRCSELILS